MGQAVHPGAGCCPPPSAPTQPGHGLQCRMAPGTCPEPWGCSGCSSSRHPSEDPGRAADLLVLSPNCPEPAQSPRGVPGDGVMLWSAHRACNHSVSPRPAHTHPLGWHPGEALGEGCPVPPAPREGWASGVAQGSAGAGHSLPMPSGRAQLRQAQNGIWESLATSCHCPSRRLEPVGSEPSGRQSWPAPGWEGHASQRWREMGL